MGKTGRVENSIRGPGPRRCRPRAAGDQAHPLPNNPQRSPGRENRRAPQAVRRESLGHQGGKEAAVLEGCGVVLSQRLPRRTRLPPSQELRAYRAAGCQAQRPNRGPHIPVDLRRPRVDGPGVCAAAVAAERSSHTPRFAPREQDKEDQQAHCRTAPESICGCVADQRTAARWRGNPASPDTLVRSAGSTPATAGLGGFSLSTACNAGYWKLIGRMERFLAAFSIVKGMQSIHLSANLRPKTPFLREFALFSRLPRI